MEIWLRLTSNTVPRRLPGIVRQLFFRASCPSWAGSHVPLANTAVHFRSFSDAEGPGGLGGSTVRGVAVASNDSAIEEKFSEGAR